MARRKFLFYGCPKTQCPVTESQEGDSESIQLSFGEVGRSTGELLKEQVEEIYQNVEAKIILLDEWDANLDGLNQNRLSNLIDQIAQKKCVIEVRHR